MKKLIISFLCILFTSMLFAETAYSLKEYFRKNILNLDPIEGEYNISLHQYLTPSAGEGSSMKGNPTFYIKKEYSSFVVYDEEGEETLYQISRIGDTNAYWLTFNHYVFGFEKHQFVLQNGIMFEINHEFTPSTVKRQINNIHNIPLSRIHSYFNIRGIKSYPTSAMYLEAAKEDARKAEQELQEAIEKAKREAGWSGTGFALNQGYIVTNYHVVEGANTIKVKGIKGDFNTEYNAKVITTDKVNDITIIKIEDERFTSFGTIPYKIKKSMSEVGESVWALGYPMTAVMGEEIKFTDGKISSRTGVQGDLSMYQISVPIQPGNSGGPLFDNYGYVVGITSAGLNREEFNSENVNYAIKTSYLYNLLESTLTTSILPQGTAMQGQPLTEKIKLAKKFVYMILCSEDPNFHKETASTKTSDVNSTITKTEQPSNISSIQPSESTIPENVASNNEPIQSPPVLKPIIEVDKQIYDFDTISSTSGWVETKFEITNKGESTLLIHNVKSSCSRIKTSITNNFQLPAGEKAYLTASYNTIVPGRFQKTITIESNASDSIVKLYVKGVVVEEVVKEEVVNNTKNTTKSKNEILVTDNSYYVSGMQYITTITKTSGWGEAASELGVKNATEMLKKEAAKRGCDVVLVTNINRGFVTSVTGKLYKR